MGVYYGYPMCCMKAFCNFESDRDIAVHRCLGFLPCPSCADKVRAGAITLEGLIKDRICNTPFPNEGTEEEKDYFVKEYDKLFA